MAIQFNKILIPVDFSVNTRTAIKKALSLCEGSNAEIRLLHVHKAISGGFFSLHQYFSGYTVRDWNMDAQAKKEQLNDIESEILGANPHLNISSLIVLNDSVEEAIVEISRRFRPDLIIIGKKSIHSWFPFLNTVVPSRLARKTCTTLLTAKPGAINDSIRTVVVPVGEKFPDNKIDVIYALKKKFSLQIKLVSFLTIENNLPVLPASLLNVYRELKANHTDNISYEVIYGSNKAKAILRYCKKVDADLLIVNPYSETKIDWTNRHLSDLLPAHSKTQILAVKSMSY